MIWKNVDLTQTPNSHETHRAPQMEGKRRIDPGTRPGTEGKHSTPDLPWIWSRSKTKRKTKPTNQPKTWNLNPEVDQGHANPRQAHATSLGVKEQGNG